MNSYPVKQKEVYYGVIKCFIKMKPTTKPNPIFDVSTRLE